MTTKFKDFMREVEEEARREGPHAVAELRAFEAHFKLATELILLRKRRKLTQRQLSARSGIQQAEISRIEGGRANPTVATVFALAKALGGDLAIRARPASRGLRLPRPSMTRRESRRRVVAAATR
jgi:transcriptional regulator with XRE-family HTH domain